MPLHFRSTMALETYSWLGKGVAAGSRAPPDMPSSLSGQAGGQACRPFAQGQASADGAWPPTALLLPQRSGTLPAGAPAGHLRLLDSHSCAQGAHAQVSRFEQQRAPRSVT